MAMESKLTPRERWRSYLEVEDRTRRCLRRLRSLRRMSADESAVLLPVLDSFRHLSSGQDIRQLRSEAQRLCRFLDEILSRIEAQEASMSDFGHLSK